MNIENKISTIRKLIDTLIIPNFKPKMEYDVKYYERYNRFVVDVTLYVDVQKMFANTENYDSNYMNDAYELENTLEDTLQYLGLPFNGFNHNIDIEYFNDDFLDVELSKLKEKIIGRLVDDFEVDESMANRLFVTTYKREDVSPYIKLEVGMDNASEINEKYGITVNKLEDIISNEIESSQDELPTIYDLYLDEIEFWFGE
jgi:hypothetical protein